MLARFDSATRQKNTFLDPEQGPISIVMFFYRGIPGQPMEDRMSDLFSRDYRMCKAVGHAVCVRRTEGQCRDENHCQQDDCPLANDFSEAPVKAGTPEFSSRIGLGWLAGRFNG
jgi:hypothetical protein